MGRDPLRTSALDQMKCLEMPAITLCTNKCSIFLSRLLISRRCLACWDGEGLQEKEEQNNHSWNKVTSSFSQERYLGWKPAEAHSGQTGFSKDWPVGADLTKTGICSRGQDSPSICKALRGLLHEPMAACGLSAFIPQASLLFWIQTFLH